MVIFDNVTKIYGNGTVALDQISFAIGSGEFVIITGPSGSGKTTLMKLMIKETEPSLGKVVIDGDDLGSVPPKNIPLLRRKVGVIFQDFKLIEGNTVAENIDLVLEIMGIPAPDALKRRNDLLELTGISRYRDNFPAQLSGGELQRLAIARSLSTQPLILFADEPTGNLDEATAKDIIALLEDINQQGTTILMATHDLDYVKHLTKARRLTFNKGKLSDQHSATHKAESHKEKSPDAKEDKKA